MTEGTNPDPDRKQRSLSVLLLAQAIILFLLGVSGSKLADAINLPASAVLLLTMVLIGMIAFIEARLLQDLQSHHKPSSQPGVHGLFAKATSTLRSAFDRIPLAFSICLITGAAVGSAAAAGIPRGPVLGVILWRGPWDYELVSFIVCAVLLYFFGQFAPNNVVLITSALGLGLGSASGILLIRRPENTPGPTLVFTVGLMLLVALLLRTRTGQGVVADIHGLLKALVRPQTRGIGRE